MAALHVSVSTASISPASPFLMVGGFAYSSPPALGRDIPKGAGNDAHRPTASVPLWFYLGSTMSEAAFAALCRFWAVLFPSAV